LQGLVTLSYLKPSTLLSHVSPRDKRILYEAEEKAKINGFPTTKELRQAREVALSRLKREEDEAEKVGLVSRYHCHIGLRLIWDIARNPRAKSLQGLPRHAICFTLQVQLLTVLVEDQGF
jgi:hypothetical protein